MKPKKTVKQAKIPRLPTPPITLRQAGAYLLRQLTRWIGRKTNPAGKSRIKQKNARRPKCGGRVA